jgi:hypothetical protein
MGSLYPLSSSKSVFLRMRIKRLFRICVNLSSRAGFLSLQGCGRSFPSQSGGMLM